MPANRTNLSLDQQFFQELLSAAYTIQEHNDRLDEAEPTQTAVPPRPPLNVVCPKCGALRPEDQPQCERCGPDDFRPGERLQHNWASMWLMSQEQGLFPERSPDSHTKDSHANATQDLLPFDVKRYPQPGAPDLAASGILDSRFAESIDKSAAAETTETIESIRESVIGRANRTNGKPVKGNGSNGNGVNRNDERQAEAESGLQAGVPLKEGSNGRSNGNKKGRSNGHSAPSNIAPDVAAHEIGWTREAPADAPIQDESIKNDLLHQLSQDLPESTSQEDFAASESYPQVEIHDLPSNDYSSLGDFKSNDSNSANVIATDSAADTWLTSSSQDLTATEVETDPEFSFGEGQVETTSSVLQRLSALRVKLRFHRADLYLGASIIVAAMALLWPVAGSTQQPSLSTWQRALIAIGIADAPQPEVHIQGDPAIEVWIDPHTALYYCPGEEQYGKTPDGRFNSQRAAQMDRFEPAGRSACE
jgi:ribosomal protein L40E